ncbi:MAG: Do family serine endopeptidase [Bryobacteraceae bacterium]
MRFFDRLRTEKLLSVTLIVFTLAIGVVVGTLVTTGVKAARSNAGSFAPDATPLTIPAAVELPSQFTPIAKQVEPSVVSISTSYMPKAVQNPNRRRRQLQPEEGDQGEGEGDNGMNDFLFRFFGNPFGEGGPNMRSRRTEALGSGVVVDRAGYILTNNHVVDKADRIRVKFHGDVAEYEAKLVGTDPSTDLAVIKVTGKSGLEPAKIGNSDGVQVGDWAVAIGSPFNYQETVTAGIISAKDREVDASMQFQHFLQTDAAINPGNSGGPLLNMRGEVIGINTAIASRSGAYEGIGFALPINTAVMVYNAIIKEGKVTRGGIGIAFGQSDDPTTAANLKASGVSEGVFVQSVTPGGPSEKAGIKDGDVVVAINGKPIRDGNQLVATVTATPIGNSLELTVVREGKRLNFKVQVADRAQLFPDRFGNGNEAAPEKEEGTAVSFGMTYETLTDRQIETLGIKEKSGVRVLEVEPNSFAEDIHLLKGDVIVAIAGQRINSIEDVKKVQSTLKPGDAVQFRVLRQTAANPPKWEYSFVAGFLPAKQ